MSSGANGVNGSAHKPEAEDLYAHPLAWWLACKLTTTLSEPRVHSLLVPSGSRVTLSTEQMLSAPKLRTRMLDAIGELPPLPAKNVPDFLREIWSELFAKRDTIHEVAEATPAGTLAADIRMVLRYAPQTEEPRDLERGSVGVREKDGARMFNARIFMERVRRICPVPFSPAEFYAALRTIGCEHEPSVRWGSWRGRAWLAPSSLFDENRPELPEIAADENDAAEPPLPEPGVE